MQIEWYVEIGTWSHGFKVISSWILHIHIATQKKTGKHWPHFHGHLKPSSMPLSGELKITPRFHGHLKASLKPLSGVIELTLPIETPVIHVPLSGRVGGTLPHKSYSSLSWVDQTANGRLRGQSPRPGFAVIGPFEPMPAGAGTASPRCHPPPDGGTLRHVNNSLPGPLSEGTMDHGRWKNQTMETGPVSRTTGAQP